MPAVPSGPLDRDERQQVAAYLGERMNRSVGLDVWTRQESALVRTDRDACTHCDDVSALVRQLATLHPQLSVTAYDLDRHADRAKTAGVEHAPTTVIRSGGRSLQIVGLCSGLLFPALLDVVGFVSHGWSPITDETREALRALEEPVSVEVMVSPFDSYSAHMARITGAFGVEAPHMHVRIIEMAEFPVLAAQRTLTEVPALTINGRRFAGAWDEEPLLEQIRRVVADNPEPVIRDHVYSTQYVTEEEAHEIARRQAEAQDEAQRLSGSVPPGGGESSGGSGLYIPGRG